MTILTSILLGVVEGITEFLPISSTGHLVLTSWLLGLEQSEFLKSFEIIIQLGAIASVLFLYWKSFLNTAILKRVAIAFIPTGIIGLLLYKVVKTYLLGNELVVVWAMLFGGIGLIVFEYLYQEKKHAVQDISTISYAQAALVGLFQSVAIIPGISRSAASIVGGLSVGLTRVAIVEFSFLLAVPTMLAATGLDLVKNAGTFSPDQFWVLAVGFVTSFVVALGAIKFLLAFVRTRTFIPFGIYRIVVALIFLFFILR